MFVIYFLCAVILPTVIPIIQEPWDYNLLIRLKGSGRGRYGFPGQLSLETRGNVMALPGRVFNHRRVMGVEDQTFTTPCCRNWTKTGWIKVKNHEAASTQPLLDYAFQWNNATRPPAEIWAVKEEKASMYSPTISSTVFKYNRNNVTVPLSVTVVARLSIESSISVNIIHADESVEALGEINGNTDNTWILQRINRQAKIQRNTTVKFAIIAKQPRDWITPILIQWMTISASSNLKTLNLGHVNSLDDIKHTYYTPLTVTTNILERDPVCLHGGEIDVTGGRCKCQSGFTGTVCEQGCGANHYGFNCKGLCSPDLSARQCRGVLNCLKDGCKCLPGLEGRYCDKVCRPGWYGNNCEQRCGYCAAGEACDKYTGKCDAGCVNGFQPPFCQRASCGLPSGGHTDATPEKLFWHSAIYEKKKGTYKDICGGTLIAPRFLVSAAWCFFSESSLVKSPARFLVLFGTEKRFEFTESTLPRGIQAQSVASLHIPQLYRGSQRSHEDDIALVEIVRPVRITPDVAPACLYVQGNEDDDLLDGDLGFVAGWGTLGTNCTNCTRNGTEIEYVTYSTCVASESLLLTIGPKKFCGQLGAEGTDESSIKDYSDVGSGFMYFRNGAWFVYGVKSASAPDKKRRISGYTGTKDYADWILTKMNDLDVKYAVLRNT